MSRDSDVIIISESSDDDETPERIVINDSPKPGPSKDPRYSMQLNDRLKTSAVTTPTASSSRLGNQSLFDAKLQLELDMAIRDSLSQLQSNGPSTESVSENSKRSKKENRGQKTWCQVRQEKEKMRPITSKVLNLDRYSQTNSEVSRSTELSDDDLPDLDDNECEIVSVQIYNYPLEECDSDCIIMDPEPNYDQPVLSKFSSSKISTPKTVVCDSSDFRNRDSHQVSKHPCKVAARSLSSEKSAFSVVNSFCDNSKSLEPAKKMMDKPPTDKANLSPLFSEESKNKLANILRQTKKTLSPAADMPIKKGKLFGEKAVSDGSDVKVNSKSNRHFMDMFDSTLAGGDFIGSDSKENFSTEDLVNFTASSIMEENLLKQGKSESKLPQNRDKHSVEVEKVSVDLPTALDDRDSDTKTNISIEVDSEDDDDDNDVQLVQIDKYDGIYHPTPVKKRKLDANKEQISSKKNNFRIVNLKLGKPHAMNYEMGPPKNRTIRNRRKSLTELSYGKTTKAASDNSENFCTDWQKMQRFHGEYPSDWQIDNMLSTELSQLHIDTITACFEEEGTEFMGHALKFVYDFSLKYQPTLEIVTEILKRGILDCSKTNIITQSYKTLMLIHSKHSDVVRVDWEMVKGLIDQVNLGKGHSHQDPVTLLKASLLLRLTISVYESELHRKDISDLKTFRQSMVYNNLSYDSAGSTNLKHLINLIICCLTWGEFEEVHDIAAPMLQNRPNVDTGKSEEAKNDDGGCLQRQEVSKLLPLLQHLLHLAIEVSSSCSDCAKMCASELLKQFIYLGFSYKKLLLQTIKSSLLRFKLVSLMLENYSENTLPCYEFPIDIRCVFECFFQAMPPSIPFTPPTTPQSEEEGEEGQGRPFPQFSQSSVEELVMLQYFVLLSYLQCATYKTNLPLRRRLHMKKGELIGLSQQDLHELSNLHPHIEDLRCHLLSLTSDLTSNTEQYLIMMLCLQESVPASC